MMDISQLGVRMIIDLEDSRDRMYLDQKGLPTIGVGHLLTKDELMSGKLIFQRIEWWKGLSSKQITDLLEDDLRRAKWAVDYNVSVPLAQNQFDALVSFVFNIGITAFVGSTLLKRLNEGLYDEVPGQLRRWFYAAGVPIPALHARRERELAMWMGEVVPQAPKVVMP